MATFYFNAAVDNDWNNLNNWWMTFDGSTYSDQATSLPTVTDDVIINGNCDSNSGSGPTVLSLTINNATFLPFITVGSYGDYNGTLTVNGTGVLNGSYGGDVTRVYGNAYFNDTSSFVGMGYLNLGGGTCIFDDYSYNTNMLFDSTSPIIFKGGYRAGNSSTGQIYDSAIFEDDCYNEGNIGTLGGGKNLSFYDNSFTQMTFAIIYATVNFYDNSTYTDSTIIGDVNFYGTSKSRTVSQSNAINGNISYYNNSYNDDTGNFGFNAISVTFHDNSYNNGIIDGPTVTFKNSSVNKRGISGTIILDYPKGINGSSILGLV